MSLARGEEEEDEEREEDELGESRSDGDSMEFYRIRFVSPEAVSYACEYGCRRARSRGLFA